jgi:hypothetical protein
MSTPTELFERWYSTPLKCLEKIPDGDGAFVVLSISCLLYERYAVAILKDTNNRATDDAKRDQFASDFGVDRETAEAFWNVIRNGFLHQAMGMQRNANGDSFPAWVVRHDFPRIALEKGSPDVLKMQPWLIRDCVLELWAKRPDLIDKNKSFPWATIWTEPAKGATV